MELKPDCIRAVMLEIEKSQKLYTNEEGVVQKEPLTIFKLYDALPEYCREDIFYSLYNLEQAGYVNMSLRWINGGVYDCAVNHMTFAGHEFLNRIRDKKQWSVVKKGLAAIRDYSLSAISAVAEGIVTAAIDSYLKGQKL